MSEPHGKTSRLWDPQRYRDEAHSPATQLPESDGVFCLLATVSTLDVRRFYAPYEDDTRGAPPFAPAMMVGLLLYAYCVGVLSSRTSALACERNLAFLALGGTERPAFRTSSACRTWPLDALADVFVPVLRSAGEAGRVKLGPLATDGTNIQGHASRHTAMRYGSMPKEADRVRAAIATLVTQAPQQETADDAALGSRRGEARPVELARQDKRWATLEAAMPRLEARAKADAAAERQRRAAAAAARRHQGPKRRGNAPNAVDAPPDDQAQTHFPEPARRIMPTQNKGGDSCGQAPVSVEAASQIIGACDVTEAAHDKQQAPPMAQLTGAPLAPAGLETPKDASGVAQKLPATDDSGSDSEAAAAAGEQRGVDPSMATDRQRQHAPEGEASSPPATAKDRMAAPVRTPAGRAWYARRTVIVEAVFGQSKAARGFRRFLRRRLAKIRGEWRWGCLTHTLLKIWRHAYALSTVSPEEWMASTPAMALTQGVRLL